MHAVPRSETRGIACLPARDIINRSRPNIGVHRGVPLAWMSLARSRSRCRVPRSSRTFFIRRLDLLPLQGNYRSPAPPSTGSCCAQSVFREHHWGQRRQLSLLPKVSEAYSLPDSEKQTGAILHAIPKVRKQRVFVIFHLGEAIPDYVLFPPTMCRLERYVPTTDRSNPDAKVTRLVRLA